MVWTESYDITKWSSSLEFGSDGGPMSATFYSETWLRYTTETNKHYVPMNVMCLSGPYGS